MVARPTNINAGTLPRPPGVYFEFEARSASVARRRTDIAGFAGAVFAEVAGKVQKVKQGKKPCTDAVRCDGLADLYDNFGVPPADGYLDAAVRGFFANGGRTCYVAPIFVDPPGPEKDDAPPKKLELCANDFVDAENPDDNGPLAKLAVVDAVSLIAAPDAALVVDPEERDKVWQALVLQAELLGDRIALLDAPTDWHERKDFNPAVQSTLAALYWPWLHVPSDLRDGGSARAVPPCGHIAGTIARRDLSRGVFAPPANMVIEGAVGVAGELANDERVEVNDDGINVIVALPGRGIRAMGARTCKRPAREPAISVTDNGGHKADVGPYKFINVRRLVTHLCEWIAEDTQWTVFEPNSNALWRAIERLVRTILFDLWRRGGLVGTTDDEAYFVRCDATTNPRYETEQGRVICLVGVRPPGPAEMIFVRIGVAEGRVELLDREVPDA